MNGFPLESQIKQIYVILYEEYRSSGIINLLFLKNLKENQELDILKYPSFRVPVLSRLTASCASRVGSGIR